MCIRDSADGEHLDISAIHCASTAAQLGFDPAVAERLEASDVYPAGCSYSLAENRIFHVQTSTAEETPDSLAICRGLELPPPSPPAS